MTTTTTRSPYAHVLSFYAAGDLAALQAGWTDDLPRTAWDERAAADFARREAEKDARWKTMREWLEAAINQWADYQDRLRPGDPLLARRFAYRAALDKMTRLEAGQ